MATDSALVGLSIPDMEALSALVSAIRPQMSLIGQRAGVDVLRWEDEASGARLVLAIEGKRVVEILPSLASDLNVRLAHTRAESAVVARANVVDEDGEQLTSLAVELEQRRMLDAPIVNATNASVVALGREVSIYPDPVAFGESRGSLLDPDIDLEGGPPPGSDQSAVRWPLRMAAESFIAYGAFGQGAETTATARLNGVVVEASRRTNAQTEQAFVVARVRTPLFEIDVCLSVDEHPDVPTPGQVIGGGVLLVGSIPSLEEHRPPKKWWRRS